MDIIRKEDLATRLARMATWDDAMKASMEWVKKYYPKVFGG